MNWRRILWPFSFPYGLVTFLRNWAFDRSILRSQSFGTPVVSIGNLSAGGTGKTPMTEFLIRNFKNENIGLVSRGYGRKTKGLILARPEHGFDEIGDEPYQIYKKFPHIHLALSENRPHGVKALIDKYDPDIVFLDDAYQHRYIKPGFQILLTTWADPFYNDLLLPAGNLREAKKGKSRADVIIVTKCPPDFNSAKAKEIKAKIKPLAGQQVFFTSLKYGAAINYRKENITASTSGILLLSGIAKPETLVEYVKSRYVLADHLKFADHHNFTPREILQIQKKRAKADLPIITTEKDWVRLKGLLDQSALKNTYYLPMEVNFLFGEGEKFLSLVRKYIAASKRAAN